MSRNAGPAFALAQIEAHRQSVRSGIAEITQFLVEVFGQKMVAYLADVSDLKTVSRWAGGSQTPRAEAQARLRLAFQIFQLLQSSDSPHTVRAWFVGMNPQLDDISPARAIREGQETEILIAAKAFMAGG